MWEYRVFVIFLHKLGIEDCVHIAEDMQPIPSCEAFLNGSVKQKLDTFHFTL